MAFVKETRNCESASRGRPCYAVRDASTTRTLPYFCSCEFLPKCECLYVRSLRESLGVSADSSVRAFASTDVAAFFKRTPIVLNRNIFDPLDKQNTNSFVVAVDPSGGGSSAFAVASAIQLPHGEIAVRILTLLHALSLLARLARSPHFTLGPTIGSCVESNGSPPSLLENEPRGSPFHMSARTKQSATNVSGRCPWLRTK